MGGFIFASLSFLIALLPLFTAFSVHAEKAPGSTLIGSCRNSDSGAIKTESRQINGLSKPLAALVREHAKDRQQSPRSGNNSLLLIENKVQVLALALPEDGSSARLAIERAGGQIDVQTEHRGLARLQSWLPVAALEKVSGNPAIQGIRLPEYGHVPALAPATPALDKSAGAVTTEGLSAMDAESWIQDTNGALGVKVGIIDLGFAGYATQIAAGELPTCTTNNFASDGQGFEGATPHGAACAEIIHDLAPNASLYLARVTTTDELEAAKDWMVSNGVDIISSSIGWYITDSGDGTGIIPDIIEDAHNKGVLWAAAAGNERLLHWGGTFNWLKMEWSGIDITAHEYSGGVDVLNELWDPTTDQAAQIPPGTDIRVEVRWNDWTNANLDYDLFLAMWDTSISPPDWRIVAEDTSTQNGDPQDTPTAAIDYTTSSFTTKYAVLFAKFGHADIRWVDFDLFTLNHWGSFEHYVPERSLDNVAVSLSVIAAGAVNVAPPYEHQDISSEGPTNGAGGAASGGWTKPNMAGYANVSTSTYGPGAFAGSSAAAPHVAGALALLKAAFPSHSPDALQATMQERAKRVGPVNQTGYGRVFMALTPSNAAALTLLLLGY